MALQDLTTWLNGSDIKKINPINELDSYLHDSPKLKIKKPNQTSPIDSIKSRINQEASKLGINLDSVDEAAKSFIHHAVTEKNLSIASFNPVLVNPIENGLSPKFSIKDVGDFVTKYTPKDIPLHYFAQGDFKGGFQQINKNLAESQKIQEAGAMAHYKKSQGKPLTPEDEANMKAYDEQMVNQAMGAVGGIQEVGASATSAIGTKLLNNKETQAIAKNFTERLSELGANAANQDDLISGFTKIVRDTLESSQGDKTILSGLRTGINKFMHSFAGSSGNYKADYGMLQTLKEDPSMGKFITTLDDSVGKIDELIGKPKGEAFNLDELFPQATKINAPDVLFHGGTSTDLAVRPGTGNLGEGVYLTNDVGSARSYAAGWAGGVDPYEYDAIQPNQIKKVQLLTNKIFKSDKALTSEEAASIKAQGYDGIATPDETIIFDPNKVKAIGNPTPEEFAATHNVNYRPQQQPEDVNQAIKDFEDMLKKPESSDIPLSTDASSQMRAEADTLIGNEGKGGFGGLSDEVKNLYQNWVNFTRTGRLVGVAKTKDFKELKDQGMDAVFRYQAGERNATLDKVQKLLDDTYEAEKTAGIKYNYKENYLYQLWKNDQKEIDKVFGGNLSLKPRFTLEQLVKDYQTGIEKGLTPKFNNIVDIVTSRIAASEKALADRNFFKGLAEKSLIQPSGKAPAGWKILNPEGFPKYFVNLGDKSYGGTYSAPPELAKIINNRLNAPMEELQKYADFASSAKNKMLSFGVSTPVTHTAINMHGVNIVARNTMANITNPKQLFRGIEYFFKPSEGAKYFDSNLPEAVEASRNGLKLSVSEYKSALENETFRNKFGSVWNDTFEKPLFEEMIPALKLQKYQNLVKSGVPEREAAKSVNDLFGGYNWEQLGKSKDFQNLQRLVFLAPDWLGSTVRLGYKIPKYVIKFNDPAGKMYRQAAAGTMSLYVMANMVNKASSGHWMFQNDPGHTFEIELGQTGSEEKRYFRPFGTAADFVRLPTDILLGLAKGDPSVAFRAVRNRLSTFASPVLALLTNTNYKGQPIYGKDKYGNPIPLKQQAGSVAGEVGTFLGFPSFGSNAIDTLTGKQSLEAGLTQGFELPFRYSQGVAGNIDTAESRGTVATYRFLKQWDKDKANEYMAKLEEENPATFNRMEMYRELDNAGFTPESYYIVGSGIKNGERSQLIANQLNKLKTKEEKNNYLNTLDGIGLINDTVWEQLTEMKNSGKIKIPKN